MVWSQKYTGDQKAFVRQAWDAGKSAEVIANDLMAAFGIEATRRAIIGLASRMKLPRRANTGPWRVYTRKHPPKLPKPKPIIPPQPKLATPRADLDAPAAIGPVGDFPAVGGCKWPMADLPDFQCCGHPQFGRGNYCEYHAHLSRGGQPRTSVEGLRIPF